MSNTNEIKNLDIDKLRIDGGTQPRVKMDDGLIQEYSELMNDGVKFPPLTVFHDGVTYWLVDGFHRYWAHCRLKHKKIDIVIHAGTQRDAILYSVGVNTAHGLRRSNADKRHAVMRLLNDPEWAQWSSREIAKRCGVTVSTVSKCRVERIGINADLMTSVRTFRHPKTGKPTQMRTENIGRSSQNNKIVRWLKQAPLKRPCVNHTASVEKNKLTINVSLDNPREAACMMLATFGLGYMQRVFAELDVILSGKNTEEVEA